MRTSFILILSLGLVGSFASCGGDDESSPGPTNTGATTSTPTGTGGSGATGGGTTTTTTSSTTTTTTSTGTGGGGSCDSWLVTYDLTGSEFFIDATLDFTITCQEPYTDDHNMGPGTITLRFPDDGGAPGEGAVTIVDYSMRQNFVTGMTGALVTTDLETTSADACGVAAGTLSGGTLSWSPEEMAPYCRDGQVSCSGVLCGISGSPEEDAPFVFDNDCTEPLALTDFVFTSGIDAFTMEAVQTSQTANQTTTLSFVGTKTSEQLDSATPGCACD